MLFKNTRIDRGIRTEYAGPTNIAQDRELFDHSLRMGEPTPSYYYTVGKLSVRPKLMRKAAREAQTLSRRCSTTLIYNAWNSIPSLQPEKNLEIVSPFMRAFLYACAVRFDAMVRQDVAHYSPDRAIGEDGRHIITGIDVGPYAWHPDNNWHRDQADMQSESLSYLLTLLGERTRFASGTYENSQYDHSAPEQFSDIPPTPDEVSTPEPGTVTVHSARSALHSAPPPACDGHPRIFLSSTVYGVFNNV